jgi:hypothetical protein
MEMTGSSLASSFSHALEALRAVSTEVSDYRAADESALLLINSVNAELARLNQTHTALIAGEVAHRSAPELGSQGLAQRAGHKSPVQFITMTNGSTRRAATTAVQVGVLMHEAATAGQVDLSSGEVCAPERPWLASVTEALRAGRLSADAAEAIRSGVGVPNSVVTAEQLASLVAELVAAACTRPDGSAGMDVDHLAKFARMRREELDLDAVRVREDEQYAARGIKLFELANGMGRLLWDMAPETFVLVKQVFDRAVSPKLKTVRFFDPVEQAKADTILADDRTPAQVGSDAFEQLLLLGAAANPHFLLGSGAPQIRVTTTLKALQSGEGAVRIEGYSALLSMRSLKRLECNGGVKLLVFDEQLQPLDVGREQRLFTTDQRAALAVKWGGCVAPGCDAPVSWTEAHHIRHWGRDHGGTNVADGILLCKAHHLLFHNNGWEIERDEAGRYWLIPPPTVDPSQFPRLLHPKSRNMHDLAEVRDAAVQPVRQDPPPDAHRDSPPDGTPFSPSRAEERATRVFA